jgi:hypothetical protein
MNLYLHMVFLDLGPVDPTIQAFMQELANTSTQPYISIQAFFKMVRIAKKIGGSNLRGMVNQAGEVFLSRGQWCFHFLSILPLKHVDGCLKDMFQNFIFQTKRNSKQPNWHVFVTTMTSLLASQSLVLTPFIVSKTLLVSD